jgi:uncharacterized heparinase superfamily protein
VFTKNPDRAILAKLLQLAQRLEARVQGDEGEFYRRPEDLAEKTSGDVAPSEVTPADLTPEEEQRLWEANERILDALRILLYVFVAFLVLVWVARLISLFSR